MTHGEGALNDEAFIDPNEFLDPGVDEEVVADGDFYGVHTMVEQEDGEETGVEDDVAVVGYIGVRH